MTLCPKWNNPVAAWNVILCFELVPASQLKSLTQHEASKKKKKSINVTNLYQRYAGSNDAERHFLSFWLWISPDLSQLKYTLNRFPVHTFSYNFMHQHTRSKCNIRDVLIMSPGCIYFEFPAATASLCDQNVVRGGILARLGFRIRRSRSLLQWMHAVALALRFSLQILPCLRRNSFFCAADFLRNVT